MRKRLLPVASLVGGLFLFSAAPVAAEGCGSLAGALATCTSSAPSSQPAPASSQGSQPAQAPQPSAPSTAPGAIGDDPAAAARILQLVNRDRVAAGLVALEARSAITSIAGGHSRTMAGRRDIWHNAAYFTASTRSSLGAKALGENVAMNGSIDDAHRRLMASPGHRANILNGSFDAVGIAVAHDEQGTLYVTQNFVDSAQAASAPAKQVAAPAAKPAPARPVAAPAPAGPAHPAPAPVAVQHVAPAELGQSLAGATAPVAAESGAPSVAFVLAGALGGFALLGMLAAVTRVLV